MINYKKGINLINCLALQNDHVMFICNAYLKRYLSFLFSKKLPIHQKTLMFKYYNVNLVCAHQFIASLARTGI